MRVKRGFAGKRRHKRTLELASGFRGRRGSCFKHAKRGVQKALKHSYRDRRAKKREFRALWIVRINAAARSFGLSYSEFLNGLTKASVKLDRKALAELAVNDAAAFQSLCETAKTQLPAA